MNIEKIEKIISEMTLEEKAEICSGADFWHLKGNERLGIPQVMVADGPHGLRKQESASDHLGLNESIKAVCFPAGCALASSFDRELFAQIGDTLGKECQAEKLSVLLGPAVNIKRSPLCGRNFEYLSEDPYLTAELAAEQVSAVQKHHVGTSVKHYLANNQEFRRMSSSSEVDERTIHEIYLSAFENVVKKGKPWTIMCSYNRVNGEYVAESKEYLTGVLRERWGFEGAVVTDWGAVNDRVKGLKSGLDLEMPTSYGINDKRIVEAVQNKELEESMLDESVRRILGIIYRYSDNREDNVLFDRNLDHQIARKAAVQSAVLLKNDDILPLNENTKTVFIGKYASTPRFQGGGSSCINAYQIDSAWDAVQGNKNIEYAQGFIDEEDKIVPELFAEALKKAKGAENVVIFAGLPDSFETEGYDRKHMRMPECQNELIEKIAEVNANTIVVLHNGAPVEMPWIDKVKGVLEMYLCGEAVGSATCDLLFGRQNPSGRLAETFPKKLEDNPSYLYFGGKEKVEYREGVFVGYRYYDTKNMEVLFPFGYGLSYTTFAYSNLKLNRREMTDKEVLTVSLDITNTGSCAGKEVVQLYVAPPENKEVERPKKELRAFTKVELMQGETKQVTFSLDERSFAYYEIKIHDWFVESGVYQIQVGKSCTDIIFTEKIEVTGTKKIPCHFDITTPIGDLVKDPVGGMILQQLLASPTQTAEEVNAGNQAMLAAMLEGLPLRAILSFQDTGLNHQVLQAIIDQINGERR